MKTLTRLLFLRSSRTTLFEVLSKISRIASYLLLLRVLSGLGFLIALWLCPVQVFAPVGAYLAGLGVAALGVFGRYEFLILRAPDEDTSENAVQLCLCAAAAVVTCSAVAAGTLWMVMGNAILMLFPAALAARAWLRLGLTLATRDGEYERAIVALFPHSIVQPIVLVSLIAHKIDPFAAFVLSDLAGQTVAALGVHVSQRCGFPAIHFRLSKLPAVWNLALANAKLPTINLSAAMSALLFAMAPLFFLQTIPNSVLAGTMALLFRVLDIPTAITTSSVSPILLREISSRRGTRDWSSKSAFFLPGVVALIVFGGISALALILALSHLTPKWQTAFAILPVVALFQASIAATTPLVDIATLANRQHGLLMLNGTAVAAAGVVLLCCGTEPILAIVLAGLIGVGRVLILSVWLDHVEQMDRRRPIAHLAVG